MMQLRSRRRCRSCWRAVGALSRWLLAAALLRRHGPGHASVGAISVLSNRADLISGGDALVRIDLGDADAASVKVR